MNQPIKIQWKSLKLLSQRIRKRYYKTLGTSVTKSPMSPPSLTYMLLLRGLESGVVVGNMRNSSPTMNSSIRCYRVVQSTVQVYCLKHWRLWIHKITPVILRLYWTYIYTYRQRDILLFYVEDRTYSNLGIFNALLRYRNRFLLFTWMT